MRNLEFPVFMITDASRGLPNFVTVWDRTAPIVFQDRETAENYVRGVLAIKKPKIIKVQEPEALRGILGAISDAAPWIKEVCVVPHSDSEATPVRVRLAGFLKAPAEKTE